MPMKRIITICLLYISCITTISAQKNQLQYLFPEFQNGQVLYKDGRMFSVSLNFSLISNRFVFIDTHDDNIIKEFAEIEKVGIVKTGNRIFQINNKGEANEIVQDANPRITVSYSGKKTDQGKKAAYGGRSHTASIDAISTFRGGGGISYTLEGDDRWIITEVGKSYQVEYDKKMKKFQHIKQFIKIYPKQHHTAIETFVRQNGIEMDSVEKVIELCNFANSLD